jgi:hypothetical protein
MDSSIGRHSRRRAAFGKRVFAALLGLAAGGAAAAGAAEEAELGGSGAAVAPTSLPGGNPADFHWGGQALLYGNSAHPTSPSRFNPDNRLAMIPQRQIDSELRLDLAARAGECNATARLRGHDDRYTLGQPTPDPAQRSDAFVNAASLRCRLGSRLSASVGREVPQWGSSFYLSPSNPFFMDTGKTDPIRELYGKDFWQLGAYLNDHLNLSLMRNYQVGSREPDPANFSPTTALKLDWVGDAASGGAILSRRDNGVRRLGLYATYIYSNAMLWYTDMTMGAGSAGWFATPGSAGAPGYFTRSKLDHSHEFFTGLFGTAYTFESGWTATTEWLSGNEGYNRDERAAYLTTVTEAAQTFSAGGEGAYPAAGVLSTALSPGLPYLGRNILFLQIARNEWDDKADVALRWAKSFSPGSGSALSFSATYYLSGQVQGFAVGTRNFGGDSSDFARLLRDSISIGLRTYF